MKHHIRDKVMMSMNIQSYVGCSLRLLNK